MTIIDGKALSAELKAQMAAGMPQIIERYGRVTHLVVILVGENPASQTYVRNKAKGCETVGMKSTVITLPEDITEADLLQQIEALNADDSVDGILVKLPLPKHIREQKVIDTISYEKDVDGFHPMNVARLWQNKPCIVACTPKGIMEMLKAYGIVPNGKRAVVIGRSNIVGKPIAKLLLDANATVTIAHSRTEDLPSITREADILVAAIGKPKFVTADMVKDGAVIIDVGINRQEDGKLCGDVDYENVAPKASFITPVPGGVGPMTITMLLQNTIECFENRMTAR